MKYDPWKIIETSFRKHMLSPEEVQKAYNEEKKKGNMYFHYDSAEEYHDEQIAYNMENFKWYEGKNGKVNFDDKHNPYSPLGLFYGQDVAVPRIRADLCKYVEESSAYLLKSILEALLKLQAQKIEAEMMYIPTHWKCLLSGHYCGLPVETAGKRARIMSSAKYGRFVEIEGLE